MTYLDGIETETWHDMKPTHNPIPLEVIEATEKVIMARAELDAAIDAMLEGACNSCRVKQLLEHADAVERELMEVKRKFTHSV